MKIRLMMLSILFCIGCKNKTLENKVSKLAENCKDTSCQIEIRKVTNFQWEKMYVFNSAASKEVIDEAIGVDYKSYSEFTKPWIFMKGGKVVYSENNPIDVEGLLDGEVIFDYPDSLSYRMYTAVDAVFAVQKNVQGKNTYYVLSQK